MKSEGKYLELSDKKRKKYEEDFKKCKVSYSHWCRFERLFQLNINYYEDKTSC